MQFLKGTEHYAIDNQLQMYNVTLTSCSVYSNEPAGVTGSMTYSVICVGI